MRHNIGHSNIYVKTFSGHGDWHSLSVPKLVEALLSVDVSAVSCGPEHVVVVGGQGDVYSWGRGYKGERQRQFKLRFKDNTCWCTKYS